MKKTILIFIIFLTVTELKANVIERLKATPVTKFDFLLKIYRDAINLQIARYMNETDNFRVRLDQMKSLRKICFVIFVFTYPSFKSFK